MLLELKSLDTLNNEEYLDRVYAKLINCNFDGVSVVSGSVSGVQTMKEKQNYFISMHCTAYQMELEVRDSIKFDNYLDRLDDNINNIFTFYY